eukprot:TRINITY_DN14935_c0_g1_i1.p1 TRINITY_DN14935_c0_g1~~TRINITY_DN14935_c0_g1_i1.p1  ORF type:complete len:561 (-),score=100.13 TRINITY_DN14935_c0_g1_i1:83-1765(-)
MDATAADPAAAPDATEYTLTFSARAIPRELWTGNLTPDPILYLYEKPLVGDLILLGNTERIQDSVDPQWTRAINVSLEQMQQMKLVIRVYSAALNVEDIKQHRLVGSAEFDFSAWVNSRTGEHSQVFSLKTAPNSQELRGRVEVTYTKRTRARDQLLFLKLSLSSPPIASIFLRISRYHGSSYAAADPALPEHWRRVHQTETLNNKSPLNARFAPISLSQQLLCGYDYDRPILIELVQKPSLWNFFARDVLVLGFVKTTVRDITGIGRHARNTSAPVNVSPPLASREPPAFARTPPKQMHVITQQTQLMFENVDFLEEKSFSEWISAGFDIEVSFGLQCSLKSNMPLLEQALTLFGEAISTHDTDKQFPVYGLGNSVPNGFMSFVSDSDLSACVTGIDRVCDCVARRISSLSLAPLRLAPIIGYVSGQAAQNKLRNALKYHVLVLFVDGNLVDERESIDELVKASALPMSVFIVGVGSNSHTPVMDRLDSDQYPLLSSGNVFAQRDIVKFVKFESVDVTGRMSPAHRQALGEIPKQFLEHMLQIAAILNATGITIPIPLA